MPGSRSWVPLGAALIVLLAAAPPSAGGGSDGIACGGIAPLTNVCGTEVTYTEDLVVAMEALGFVGTTEVRIEQGDRAAVWRCDVPGVPGVFPCSFEPATLTPGAPAEVWCLAKPFQDGPSPPVGRWNCRLDTP